MAEGAALQDGLVVSSHGRHCMVEMSDGRRVICHPRGKKSEVVVGDRVRWQASQDEGTIESVQERRNLLYRRDEVRSKSFAANLDQVLVLVAADPDFSEHSLARALIAAEASGIAAFIGLNKSDLVEPFERASLRLASYRRMGYGVLPLSLTNSREPDRAALLKLLTDKTTLVLGPSGAGKSTMVNLLVPSAAAQTGEVSQALRSGRHTTSSTHLYWLDDARGSALIDSPGFQEFGLQHVPSARLAECMPDLRANLGGCRFYNCTHLHEPGCSVISAVEPAAAAHPISVSRYKIYSELFAELS